MTETTRNSTEWQEVEMSDPNLFSILFGTISYVLGGLVGVGFGVFVFMEYLHNNEVMILVLIPVLMSVFVIVGTVIYLTLYEQWMLNAGYKVYKRAQNYHTPVGRVMLCALIVPFVSAIYILYLSLRDSGFWAGIGFVLGVWVCWELWEIFQSLNELHEARKFVKE